MARAPLPRLALMLSAAMAMLAACDGGSDGMVRAVVIGDQPPSLGDPLGGPASEADAVLRASLAQGLVRFDAAGQIEPGLAERWNVSDDGLSYIFRLADGEWEGGSKITAREVARMLSKAFKVGSIDPVRDALGAVDEVVAMTDRVIEIRLRAPRANLLTLLAQPDFALIRGGSGTGPFTLAETKDDEGDEGEAPLRLRRRIAGFDGGESESEEIALQTLPAMPAIAAFRDKRVEVVLGGTVADLPLAQRTRLPRGVLRFDPAAGLFGLIPVRASGVGGDEEVRRILAQAIDRPALIAALGVPGLVPRATILQQGLSGLGTPPQPGWLAQPAAERRAALLAAIDRAIESPRGADSAPRPIAVGLPVGPGGDLILSRLMADWGALGFTVTRAGKGERADFRLVDQVAPSDSPAWFVRRFRCGVAAVCLADVDPLLLTAREIGDPRQRAALLAEVAAQMDAAQLFIPIAAPIRWSLVARSVPGFAENRYARHPLAGFAAREPLGNAP